MRSKILLIIIILFQIGVQCYAQSDSEITIGSITVEGDKITHKPIIIRELEFVEGEILSENELDEKIISIKNAQEAGNARRYY